MIEEYIFILGNNPELSVAEIKALYPQFQITEKTNLFLIGKMADFDCDKAIKRLGGTIKISRVIGSKADKELIIGEIVSKKSDSKINYGLSFYETKPTKMGMEIKKELKARGLSSRLVTSKEKILSSVIVKKNKVLEFLILPNLLGLTCAVQEFEEYGKRDYGRPKSDAHSGMLPPKLARIMINLSQTNKSDVILDPFCGSGTVLTESLALGYKNLIASDSSAKACEDTKDNLNWLAGEYGLTDAKYAVYNISVDKLSDKIKPSEISAIITEPYLGPTIKDDEKESHIFKIISGLVNIYLKAFNEFKTVLKPAGLIVIIMPFWHLKDREFRLGLENKITALGFKRLDRGNLIYKRQNQKVWRQIEIWQV
ncbi:MAG: DNA methyltransferase [Candidatus Buchananbacteria bacterium]|nr:DNA methyltransferase [Candidatus Buchananbacteria bacterium]